jgi:hypothetical protein
MLTEFEKVTGRMEMGDNGAVWAREPGPTRARAALVDAMQGDHIALRIRPDFATFDSVNQYDPLEVDRIKADLEAGKPASCYLTTVSEKVAGGCVSVNRFATIPRYEVRTFAVNQALWLTYRYPWLLEQSEVAEARPAPLETNTDAATKVTATKGK